MADQHHIGESLPDLKVQTADSTVTSVKAHLGSQGTLVSFLHGTWCVECASHLYSLRQHRQQIAAAGADVVVITLDKPEVLAAFLASAVSPLEYTALADPDHSAHKKAGIGQDTISLVVDGRGVVRWLASWSNHRDRPSYEIVLQAVVRD